MAESDALFPLADLPETPPPSAGPQPYLVLARKYRPQTFSELIGQEPVVRTLSNAIMRDRLAHAFLLTGVRGVGKTSTARLLAKSLNCIGPDGQGGPTIDACGVCTHCVAIAAGRDIDVVEMDAASHTGVDDVREIIDAAKYAAVSARYKIYIVDEVHMLSRQAFNALLKTLEEPPAHVKFVFATTEVEKLPVTVLSRCQRFDLRRIPTARLAEHFGVIVAREGVPAEADALALVARAAEGSVRDGLSILDQAIANAGLEGEGQVTAEQVRRMLGLTGGAALRDLLAAILAGDAEALLAEIDRQHEGGADPQSMVVGLLGLVHAITRQQAGGEPDPALAPSDRERLTDWAERLSPPVLHRLWQMLLKASAETASSRCRARPPRWACCARSTPPTCPIRRSWRGCWRRVVPAPTPLPPSPWRRCRRPATGHPPTTRRSMPRCASGSGWSCPGRCTRLWRSCAMRRRNWRSSNGRACRPTSPPTCSGGCAPPPGWPGS